jgi:hypothetical protein
MAKRAANTLGNEFLEIVNRTKVSPALLREVVEMHTAMPPDDRPVFEATAYQIFELLKKKGLRGHRKVADLSMTINFRLIALAQLQRVAAFRGWSMPGEEPGMVRMSGEVLVIAADEPLIENAEKQVAFDLESFRGRLLTITKPDGHA